VSVAAETADGQPERASRTRTRSLQCFHRVAPSLFLSELCSPRTGAVKSHYRPARHPLSPSLRQSRRRLPSPVEQRPTCPFEGTLQGTDADSDPTPSTIVVTTDGSGIGTLLGRFSFTQRVTLSFATGTSAGVAHWVAANGDSIDTTVAGSGHPTGTPGEFDITDVHTITGGTGRFAGTHGSFTVQRVASAVTFTTSGSYDGTIASPSAAR